MAGLQDRIDRRTVLGGLLAACGAYPALAADAPAKDQVGRDQVGQARAGEDQVGARLAPWRPGGLDIHHIATGRGNAELIVAQDGTTILIDAGAMYAPPPMDLAIAPSAARRPGEWVGRYVQRRLKETGGTGIDYAILTHLHPDHIGDLGPETPYAPSGNYRLTGISDVDALAPIGVLLDRGFPDYGDVALRTAPFAKNYIAYVQERVKAGRTVERLQAGSAGQVRLSPAGRRFPFELRTIAVGGNLWTGQGDAAVRVFPPLAAMAVEDQRDENIFSAALRIEAGRFRYYSPGDLTSNTFDGALPWRDIGARAAQAAGPVDVAAAPHHGLFDGMDAEVARALRPRIWVIDAWHVSHPTLTTLERLYSERLYPGPRDVLTTGLSEASYLVNERLARRFASRNGHVVIRVAPGGETFHVAATSNADENDTVSKRLGPFRCAGGA